MSNSTTRRPVDPRSWDPASTRPVMARSSAKPSRKRTALVSLGAAAALAAGTVGFSALGTTQAEAKVLPVTAVTAHAGSVRVPSGALRCTKPGQYHATVNVRTTRTTKAGTHIASVQIQYQHGGRSTFAGYANGSSTVPVTFCISPAQVEGGYGQIRGIASDVMDGGKSRSFIIRLAR